MYDTVKIKLYELFEDWNIPVPILIQRSFSTDACDVTDPPTEIRIDELQDCDDDYHARHLFGHYIADFDGINDEYSELIADTISNMIIRGKK